MKLRHKLTLLVITATFLVALPVLYLTYRNITQNTLVKEAEIFTNIINFEFESISTAYLNLLDNKVSQVLEIKKDLAVRAYDFDIVVRGVYSAPSLSLAEKEELVDRNNNSSEKSDINILFVNNEKTKHIESLSAFSNNQNFDLKGRSLADLNSAQKLPMKGDYAVFTTTDSGKTQTFLAFFLPVLYIDSLPDSIIINYTSRDELNAEEEKELQDIILATQNKFSKIQLYDKSFIALLDKDFAELASKGTMLNMEYFKKNIDLAKIHGTSVQTNAVDKYGEYLIQVGYLKALDWVIISAAPLKELIKVGEDLVSRLILLTILIATFVQIITLGSLSRTLQPLKQLTAKVGELAKLDLNNQESIHSFTKNLPSQRKDEIGLLASSFKTMADELSSKIASLIETTSSKERMQGELNAARDIQLDILNSPTLSPNNDKLESAFFLEAAKEVGGDLYDYFYLKNGKLALIIGDVSGKGVPASLFMSMTVTIVRYALTNYEACSNRLDIAIENVNSMLAAHNTSNMFVTLFVALYDPESGELEYVNGGHCQPLIVNSKTKEFRTLAQLSGPMVGVFDDVKYQAFYDKLQVGDLFLASTDGVSEAMNPENVLYSDKRLQDFLKDHPQLDPKELLDQLYASVVEFREDAEVSDDITMFSFKRI